MLSILSAGYSAVILGVISFLLLGLLSERVAKAWENALFGDHALVALVVCGGITLVSFVLILGSTAARAQTSAAKWFFAALGSSLLAGGIGVVAFALAQKALPRRWFSRGGDWDIDPLLEMAVFALAWALAGFWLVYRRSWREKALADNHHSS